MLDRQDWQKAVQPGRFTIGGSGHTFVAVTNTAKVLRSTTPCAVVALRAERTNSGILYFGGSDVTNDGQALTGGLQLSPGDWIVFSETDLAHVFINGGTPDGVSYVWWT